ncbi:PfkB family carbohydrate kinase [Cereibacter sphaeroides]|jgi:sugar/nucleoside kinase (ribokinase family)|uniref:PfkB family carbohydrate kinase n=1 Tax=Cereibacter sphaeroides TaxID=1063 RepID=UPI0000663C76|nr:PfkB family carbohydrate kinase [Cereibacter sphaeroides]ABN76544.1 PfkB domain protein [Cereibacter sphaeroides ATCC 17029]ACM00958.1 PfkB domain protein [Cereibacter sphaeroides KD131]MWP36695.1 kinase [Cereibacter sphaeroides]
MSVPAILCIGAVQWDLIGHTADPMPAGADLPGRVSRMPGGVAFNIAQALAREGLTVALLATVGTDAEGEGLVRAGMALGLDMRFLHRGGATDLYLALEAEGALVGAVADARALEEAGEAVLEPLRDGRLATEALPFAGTAVIDGNLPTPVLSGLAASGLLARADLRLAPASPAKAPRLAPLLAHPGAVLHLNRAEAAAICGADFPTSLAAAEALLARGVARVLVTDGALPATDGCARRGLLQACPPAVPCRRATGAGDAFLAAHLAAEHRGAGREAALAAALAAAAALVSGDVIS